MLEDIWYIAPKQTRAMRRHQTITKANDEMVREIIQARSADYREHIPAKEYLRSSLILKQTNHSLAEISLGKLG